ncbi:sugar phosphate nucleotidyltransferase [Candidatus Aminicenantes bacterium AC-335-A11]|nr:sugar phosphate nucleotidyltransferase [Candidatus Aminicenantes bacterium AC-708-I09]MCP2618764.1 sugar phosphate nucleotidyltransferase [Candidatus Aminicenantes bacterium AC-335-A11]
MTLYIFFVINPKGKMEESVKVVILCGGKGLRLRKDPALPKPLVEIGGLPILWHIMKIYAHYGFNSFILCLGFKGDKIKEYFENRGNRHPEFNPSEFEIEFVDTGLNTETGGRVKLIEKYIKEENFFLTYADGLADINLNDLYNFHLKNNKILTMTCVRAKSQFGICEINDKNEVVNFEQKPLLKDWVNGGFFVCNRKIFDYLDVNDILEEKPFQKLIEDKQICAYKFTGFWACMDTYKDAIMLNEAWNQGKAKWKIW